MTDVNKNFGSSLILDFRKWWRHMQANNDIILSSSYQKCELRPISLLKRDYKTFFQSYNGMA